MSVPFLSCHSHFYGLHHLSGTDDYACRRFWRNVLHYVDCRCRCHDECILQVLSRFVAVLGFGAFCALCFLFNWSPFVDGVPLSYDSQNVDQAWFVRGEWFLRIFVQPRTNNAGYRMW